ncbi:hypothetical protein FSP39_013263 [Pinctada imbricata]|uniref:Hexosyltransferase n=1 Tax=Pinctada imbricata TaxID=66713 RepID=A0AA88YTH3_PINIB|nr:hypothetical protein FSP39_013263 [Pinctada imbricata]
MKQFLHIYILLLPFLLYITLQCYKASRPWCEELLSDYPIKIDLEPIRLGNTPNKWLDGINPVNKNSYKFIHRPNPGCQMMDIDILSLVKSKPDHFRLREAIRKTWGKQASTGRNKLVFSLGKVESSSLQKQIDQESAKHRDILQGQFKDTYNNVTLKMMYGIYWIAKFCSNARFVSLIDDDVIVNFFNLQKFFSEVKLHQMDSLFSGYVFDTTGPFRFMSKWSTSLEKYPYPCFPPYVTGLTIVTTGNVIKMFNTAIPYVKFLPYDDVYFGIVALKLGIRLSAINNDKFDFWGTRIHELSYIISSHPEENLNGIRYEELYFHNI